MNKLNELPNLTELSYRSIKQSILNGSVERSTRLTEEYFASQLGISKSPVREALNRLEAEGLIRIEPRRGVYVRDFSHQEISDLYDVRVVLELHSIDAAEITPQMLGILLESIARTKEILHEGNKSKHIEEDFLFHRTIAEATGNAEFCRIFENVQQKTLLCRYKSYELSATTSPLAHKKIYQALKRGDKKGAQVAMRSHIVFVRDRLLKS